MENTELIAKALKWFEKEYHQTPAQHGYPFISTRKKIKLFKPLNEVVFAKDEQNAQDYIYARRFIERSSFVFYGIVLLLLIVASAWLYFYSPKLAFYFYILALIVVILLILLFIITYICYKVVSPLEEKYKNNIAIYRDAS